MPVRSMLGLPPSSSLMGPSSSRRTCTIGQTRSSSSSSADSAMAVYRTQPYFSRTSPRWVMIRSRGMGPRTATVRGVLMVVLQHLWWWNGGVGLLLDPRLRREGAGSGGRQGSRLGRRLANRVVHVLELLALGLLDPLPDEDQREQRADGVEAVGQAE